jgi:hypothetical protein
MPWIKTSPPAWNKHTLKAEKLDRKASKAAKRGDTDSYGRLTRKADRRAAKGGWF